MDKEELVNIEKIRIKGERPYVGIGIFFTVAMMVGNWVAFAHGAYDQPAAVAGILLSAALMMWAFRQAERQHALRVALFEKRLEAHGADYLSRAAFSPEWSERSRALMVRYLDARHPGWTGKKAA